MEMQILSPRQNFRIRLSVSGAQESVFTNSPGGFLASKVWEALIEPILLPLLSSFLVDMHDVLLVSTLPTADLGQLSSHHVKNMAFPTNWP